MTNQLEREQKLQKELKELLHKNNINRDYQPKRFKLAPEGEQKLLKECIQPNQIKKNNILKEYPPSRQHKLDPGETVEEIDMEMRD